MSILTNTLRLSGRNGEKHQESLFPEPGDEEDHYGDDDGNEDEAGPYTCLEDATDNFA